MQSKNLACARKSSGNDGISAILVSSGAVSWEGVAVAVWLFLNLISYFGNFSGPRENHSMIPC